MKDVKQVNCSDCQLQKQCFSASALTIQTDEKPAVDYSILLTPGEHLYQIGEQVEYLYTVKSGAFKAYRKENQLQEVAGFSFPGEILGIDSIGEQFYNYNVVSLDRSLVCRVPLLNLETLLLTKPELNKQILNLMSVKIHYERKRSNMLICSNAEQKIANFIKSLSDKFFHIGLQHRCFKFSVLQRDVASFLGISPETMSRTLTKFAEQKIVEWRCQEINILDEKTLMELAK